MTTRQLFFDSVVEAVHGSGPRKRSMEAVVSGAVISMSWDWVKLVTAT